MKRPIEMNIQIYSCKKNFDVQKAERFFKERRIACTLVDLKKHRPGKREIALFASVFGIQNLINRQEPAVRSHPVSYTQDEERITEYLTENPSLMRLPIIRNGQKMTLGADEKTWKQWLEEES